MSLTAVLVLSAALSVGGHNVDASECLTLKGDPLRISIASDVVDFTDRASLTIVNACDSDAIARVLFEPAGIPNSIETASALRTDFTSSTGQALAARWDQSSASPNTLLVPADSATELELTTYLVPGSPLIAGNYYADFSVEWLPSPDPGTPDTALAATGAGTSLLLALVGMAATVAGAGYRVFQRRPQTDK